MLLPSEHVLVSHSLLTSNSYYSIQKVSSTMTLSNLICLIWTSLPFIKEIYKIMLHHINFGKLKFRETTSQNFNNG